MAKRCRASGDNEDRITYLPPTILSNILSRLSTTEAVRTSILSSKWKYKWTTVYNLNLEFDDFDIFGADDDDDDGNNNNNDNEDNNDNNDDNDDVDDNEDYLSYTAHLKQRVEEFSNFVDRVLIFHGGAGATTNHSLRRFVLRCSPSSTSFFTGVSRIANWISAALSRDVGTLEIDFPKASLVLPPRRYTTCDLQELKLLSQITLTVPNDNLFSTLKIIDFNNVKIKNVGRQVGRRRLALKFPALESLHIRCCKWIDMTSVKFDAPLLKDFNLTYDGYRCDVDVDGDGNGEINNYYNYRLLRGFVFEICSSNLVTFKANGNLTENYVLPKKCTIQTATFHLFWKAQWSASGHRVAGTLKQMNVNLKHLILSGATLTGLQQAAQIIFLPVFQKLNHLEIRTMHYAVTDAGAVVQLLHHTPVLETLTIDMTSKAEKDMHYKKGDGIEIVPECLVTNLKVVNFICFYSRLNGEGDISFLRFILKNARVLQQVRLINNKARNIGMRAILSPEIQRLLMIFPRASNDAKIFLVN